MTAEQIARALGGRRSGDGWVARCPVHADRNPSLSVTERDGKLLVHCHAGCPQRDVIEALKARKLWPERRERAAPSRNGRERREHGAGWHQWRGARFPASWGHIVREHVYRDEHGCIPYVVVRFEPKSFRPLMQVSSGRWAWRLPERLIPYHLPVLLRSGTVLLCEGERDCDTLLGFGLCATTNPGGAKKFGRQFRDNSWARFFAQKRILIVPDNDAPGLRHAAEVAETLRGIAREIAVIRVPQPAKDVTEAVQKGLISAGDFHEIAGGFWWCNSVWRSIMQPESRLTAVRVDTLTTEELYRVLEQPLPADGGKRPAEGAAEEEDAAELVSFNLTDVGNAKRLVKLFGDRIRYCHPQRAWYVWTGARWEQDALGAVMEMAKEAARRLYGAAWHIADHEAREKTIRWALRSEGVERLRAALVAAQSEPGIPIQPSDFDRDLFLLNCANGTVDLRTGELRPHSKEDYCSRLAPVEYDPGARSELWGRFLSEACGGDQGLIDFLQRAIGYSLTGDTSEEVLFLVLGPGGSGKTTLVEAVKSALGDYGKTADFETFLAREGRGGVRDDVAELAGRRFVVGVEVERGRRLAEGLVKLLTGGDSIRARFLYQEAFEFRPQFKLWLCANDPPHVRHGDSAMWRRILRIPFERVVPPEKRDPSVKARLKDPKESGPAILAWAVEGCLRWQREGLGVPGVVRSATDELRREMDPLRDFLVDRCMLAPHAWTATAKLREAYERHCQEQGAHPLGARAFAAALEAHGCEQERRFLGRGWRGIGLLEQREQGA